MSIQKKLPVVTGNVFITDGNEAPEGPLPRHVHQQQGRNRGLEYVQYYKQNRTLYAFGTLYNSASNAGFGRLREAAKKRSFFSGPATKRGWGVRAFH